MLTENITLQPSCADDYDPDALPVDEARQHIIQAVKPITAFEKLHLRDTLGRILADDIMSPFNVPGYNNSAMDGYALNCADLQSEIIHEFSIAGTAYAGKSFKGTCQTGECIRIMTGAPIPDGTDTVVMQEHAEALNDNCVRIGNIHKAGQNIRLKGEDIPQDSVVLKKNRQIVPSDLGVLASLGIGEVNVRRRVRVAFFSTGDELRSIGETLNDGEIYDSNRYSLYGMLAKLGCEILDMGVVRDDPDALREAFQNASTMADVVITSGGVSVGDADYIKPVLDDIGEINFWKIAMKPGRPLTFGKLDNALFFGLPGNPVAVMVSFYQFVQPALHYLAQGEEYMPHTVKAICTTPLRKRPGRFEFKRGYFSPQDNGKFEVRKAGHQGSGILTSMSHANCFILLPEDSQDIGKGDHVIIQPFATFI